MLVEVSLSGVNHPDDFLHIGLSKATANHFDSIDVALYTIDEFIRFADSMDWRTCEPAIQFVGVSFVMDFTKLMISITSARKKSRHFTAHFASILDGIGPPFSCNKYTNGNEATHQDSRDA